MQSQATTGKSQIARTSLFNSYHMFSTSNVPTSPPGTQLQMLKAHDFGVRPYDQYDQRLAPIQREEQAAR
jgi:hypothetical protein